MKILLIGEYSNIHWTLAKALRNMGHRVDVLSHSNLWLNNSDYLYPNRSSIRWGVLKNTFNLLKTLPQLRGYDVVQLVNPYFLELKRRCLKRMPSFFVMPPVYYPFLFLKHLWSSQLSLFGK